MPTKPPKNKEKSFLNPLLMMYVIIDVAWILLRIRCINQIMFEISSNFIQLVYFFSSHHLDWILKQNDLFSVTVRTAYLGSSG